MCLKTKSVGNTYLYEGFFRGCLDFEKVLEVIVINQLCKIYSQNQMVNWIYGQNWIYEQNNF